MLGEDNYDDYTSIDATPLPRNLFGKIRFRPSHLPIPDTTFFPRSHAFLFGVRVVEIALCRSIREIHLSSLPGDVRRTLSLDRFDTFSLEFNSSRPNG